MKAIAIAIVTGALMLTGLGACASSSMDARMSGCLRDAGHDSSLENIDKRRVEQPAFSRAFEDCAAKHGVSTLPAGEEIRRVDEHVHRTIRCMQAAGWRLPEPKRGEHGALVWDGMDALVPSIGSTRSGRIIRPASGGMAMATTTTITTAKEKAARVPAPLSTPAGASGSGCPTRTVR